eukprot:COSAG06_NODE_61638_length_267_cov_0.613095_1_plen_35_part_10
MHTRVTYGFAVRIAQHEAPLLHADSSRSRSGWTLL